MLAKGEAEPGSPGGAEEVRAPEPECVEDCDRVPRACGQRVGTRLTRLVAAALAAVIGEYQAELAG